jgi:hypothetical protein
MYFLGDQIKMDVMGVACNTHGKDLKLYNILGEVLRRRQYLGYQDVDGKIILEN